MTLLWVIGNGFDLQHHIPSRYQDFRDWLHSRQELPPCSDDHVNCWIRSDELSPRILPKGDEDYSEEIATKFLCRIMSTCGTADGWNDLETSLGVLEFETIFDDFDATDRDGDPDYWQNTARIEDHSGWIKHTLMEIFPLFHEWVNSELSTKFAAAHPSFSSLFSVMPRKFLTFNYTRTLEKTYGVPSNEIVHLHGCEQGDLADFRFGHGEPARQEADYAYGAGNDLVHDFHEASRKVLNLNALDALDFGDVSGVVFYGFGFGKVDLPYLEKLSRRCPPGTPWYLIKRDRQDYSALTKATPAIQRCCPQSVFTIPLEDSKLLKELADSQSAE